MINKNLHWAIFQEKWPSMGTEFSWLNACRGRPAGSPQRTAGQAGMTRTSWVCFVIQVPHRVRDKLQPIEDSDLSENTE
jgi:hypothetical protein